MQDNYPKNLMLPIAIGYILRPIVINGITYKKKNYIMLMEEYKSFFNFHKNSRSISFINEKCTRNFVLKLIGILLKISNYLEMEHKLINLDFKIDNIMYYYNDLIVIDLGLIKKFETDT